MDSEWISKKELLERYQISYGALYRWKRRGLIPEEWFVKKATVTGQETFFPRARVCERVEQILCRGDEQSLDDLYNRLYGEPKPRRALVLKTVFGERRFSSEDVSAVILEKGDGNSEELTDFLFPDKKEKKE